MDPKNKHPVNLFFKIISLRNNMSDYLERMDIHEPSPTQQSIKEAERMIEKLAILIVIMIVIVVAGSFLVLGQ